MPIVKKIELASKKVISAVIQIFLPKKTKKPNPPYNRILFIRFDVLGDMIISLPVLRACRNNLSSSRIDIICSFRNETIIKSSGYVDNTFITTKNPFRNIGLIFKLRKNKYDLVINLVTRPSLTYGIIARLIGPGAVRVGNDQRSYEYFYTHLVDLPSKNEIHITKRLIKLCSFLINNDSELLATPWVSYDEETKSEAAELFNWVQDKLKLNGTDAKVVAINLSAGLARRDWEFNSFLEFIKSVIKTHSGEIDGWIIFKNPVNPNESEKMVELINNDRVISLPLVKDFKVLIEFLKFLYIIVTPDTSFMHAASAVGSPVLGLMAEEKIPEWGPLSNPSKVVDSKNPLSLKEIPVDYVIKGLDELMTELRSNQSD